MGSWALPLWPAAQVGRAAADALYLVLSDFELSQHDFGVNAIFENGLSDLVLLLV